MLKRIAKITMLVLMLAGIIFSLSNFLAVKSEAGVIYKKLETGTDPYTGKMYVRCWGTGQACVTVSPSID